MKKCIAFMAVFIIAILGIYGCSGTDSGTPTSMNDENVKTATVTIKADFGQDKVNAAFYSDIDNITLEYYAGCSDTQNLFEYYYVDNNNTYLLNEDNSTPIFLAQFYESLYDLYVKTKLAELDNTTPADEYYDLKFNWSALQSIPINCSVSGNITLTPDNNSVTIPLPTGKAKFRAYLNIVGRGTVDRASSAGTLTEGENNVVLSSLRGTWTLTNETGGTLTPQITEALNAGVKSINKLHLSRNFANMKVDLHPSLADLLYNEIKEDPLYYQNMNDYYTGIATTYSGTKIYKTNYPPFRTEYYGGIYEVTIDNGSGNQILPAPGLFNIAQGFTGGTADNATWNGFNQFDALELELPSGKLYMAFIMGYKISIDNSTVNSFSTEPITTVSGDTMNGWVLEALGSGRTETCSLYNNGTWVTLTSCEPLDNMTIASASTKDALIKAFAPRLSAAALYPDTEGCLDNLTNSWTDLNYYYNICYNASAGTVYWPSYLTAPTCNSGYTLIQDAYIKAEVTETIEKACMQKFTGTRQSDFDLSDLFSNVIVNIN